MSGATDYFFAPERFEHERFVLRSFLSDDAERLHRAVTDSHEHLSPWMPWAKKPQTLHESRCITRQFRGRYLLGEDFGFLILDPRTEEVLGASGFHLRGAKWQQRQAETGMWIHAARAGQGLGTEVLRTILAWGFEAWPWDRIEWRCDSLNTASRRCAEKAGMAFEGILRRHEIANDGSRRDTVIYAALRPE